MILVQKIHNILRILVHNSVHRLSHSTWLLSAYYPYPYYYRRSSIMCRRVPGIVQQQYAQNAGHKNQNQSQPSGTTPTTKSFIPNSTHSGTHTHNANNFELFTYRSRLLMCVLRALLPSLAPLHQSINQSIVVAARSCGCCFLLLRVVVSCATAVHIYATKKGSFASHTAAAHTGPRCRYVRTTFRTHQRGEG